MANDDNATKQDLLDLEQRLNIDFTEMEQRLKTSLDASLGRLETHLLSAFHGWARATEIKIKSASNSTAAVDERMSLLEERMLNLERRQRS